MERLWPKFARKTEGGHLPMKSPMRKYPMSREDRISRTGIAHSYGDLQDVVEMLAREPMTRQAWIPLFFPEDTGVADGGRKPCTLGYQFLVRDGRCHIYYPLRSCDFIRHWRDDCYLAVRLLLWVIDRCRDIAPDVWNDIKPGTYAMHMTSLHIFENDRRALTSPQA
jgi:thymidylate synthase